MWNVNQSFKVFQPSYRCNKLEHTHSQTLWKKIMRDSSFSILPFLDPSSFDAFLRRRLLDKGKKSIFVNASGGINFLPFIWSSWKSVYLLDGDGDYLFLWWRRFFLWFFSFWCVFVQLNVGWVWNYWLEALDWMIFFYFNFELNFVGFIYEEFQLLWCEQFTTFTNNSRNPKPNQNTSKNPRTKHPKVCNFHNSKEDIKKPNF